MKLDLKPDNYVDASSQSIWVFENSKG